MSMKILINLFQNHRAECVQNINTCDYNKQIWDLYVIEQTCFIAGVIMEQK